LPPPPCAFPPQRSRYAVFPRHPRPIDLAVDGSILSCSSARSRVLRLALLSPFLESASPGVRAPSAPWVQLATPRGSTPEVRPRPQFLLPARAYIQPVLSGLISSRKRSWGSHLQGFPLGRRPERSSRSDSPPVVPTVATASSVQVPRTSRHRGLGRLQGLYAVRVRSLVAAPVRVLRRPVPSWCSSSLRVCRPPVMGPKPTSPARWRHRAPLRVHGAAALQSLPHHAGVTSSLEAVSPFRGLPPPGRFSSSRARR